MTGPAPTSTRPVAAAWGRARRPGSCAVADYERQPGADANRSRFYLNDGSGTFTDAGAASGLELDRIIAFTGVFSDVDGDGWEDLLVTGDACTSRLYRNDGGKRFVDVTDESGTGTDENGMGSVVADVDQDGNLDWFVTSIGYPTDDGTCPGVRGVRGVLRQPALPG